MCDFAADAAAAAELMVGRTLSVERPGARSCSLKYVGVDLHKKAISVCVMIQEGRKRKVVAHEGQPAWRRPY